MDISLAGKTAVICGSTQGMGLAIAQEMAECGASCILLARNEAKLKETVSTLRASGDARHEFVVADFSNTASVQAAIDDIVRRGTVHILVNNTGGPKSGPILDADEQAFRNAFEQHVVCNQLLAKAVIPGMKSAGYGRIINIVSTSVRVPLPYLGISNTIRAAVASWSKSLSNEVARFNITVNNILPGSTDTQRIEDLIVANAKRLQVTEKEMRDVMINEIPMRRFANPKEIATVAAFLASPAASYVTGVSMPVDGGKIGAI